MQTIVVASVFVFFTDAPTYLKPERWSYSDIARIEKAMNVSTEQQAVGKLVPSFLSVWSNVGCFQRWQRSFLRNSALPPIGINDPHAKSALAQSRLNDLGSTEGS